MTDLEYANKRLAIVADRLQAAYISLFAERMRLVEAVDAYLLDPTLANLDALRKARQEETKG